MQKKSIPALFVFIAALFLIAASPARADDAAPKQAQQQAKPKRSLSDANEWTKEMVPEIFALDLAAYPPEREDIPGYFTQTGWASFRIAMDQMAKAVPVPKAGEDEEVKLEFKGPVLLQQGWVNNFYNRIYAMTRESKDAAGAPVSVPFSLGVVEQEDAPDGFAIAAFMVQLEAPRAGQGAAPPACPNLKPGQFGGIGMIPFMKDGELRVMNVIEGKPAARAGLRIGDQITEIDGKPVAGLNNCDVIGMIRGEAGTTVTLKILRGKDKEILSVPLLREMIQPK